MAQALALQVAAPVLNKLSSAAFEEICSMWGVGDELEKLRDVLTVIQTVLVEAEEQQTQNRPEIAIWLQKLKGACYQVEDLLDEVEIEALRHKVLERGSTERRVRHYISSSNPVAFRFHLAQKIKEAKGKLDEFATMKDRFNLHVGQPVKKEVHGERETHSSVRKSNMVGREEDKENIVKFLINPTDHVEDATVLPIVGIGGIGKTALAQLVFNDERVKAHFESRTWACDGEDFDIKQMMIKIIKSAIGTDCTHMNKEELQKALQDHLKSKRCIVVFDDVWNDDIRRWRELKDLLCGIAEGSKIIVTTRSHRVAEIASTTSPYVLGPLSNENCLSLFLKLAFKEGEEKQHQNLVRIGEGIVRKCNGVALAVETLGSLLRFTREERRWKAVRDSELWELEQGENDILPALKLSYDHLPWYLKPCFAFCSVFPKDFGIDSAVLISMWMANGLLESTSKHEEPEDIGNRYIQELSSRSFFQQLEQGSFSFTFKLHDLLHDLALSVSQNEVNCLTGDVRHLWYDVSGRSASQLPNNMGHLRTLIFWLRRRPEAGSESLVEECISKAKQLRVLDMAWGTFYQFSNNIGDVKHLRHLSIAGNRNIKSLPDSVCDLQSLETLDLMYCTGLEALPKDIRYLISLRALWLTTRQTSLQGSGIECLTSLRKLVLWGCGNLKFLFQDIHCLTALRTLRIVKCNNLISLPNGLKCMTSLETLGIKDCEKLDLCMEPALGGKEDGSLRNLFIEGLPMVKSLSQWIVLGSTRTLQRLQVSELENLSMLPTWFQHLMSVQELVIADCPKLSSLPEGMQHLTALNDLRITRCPNLKERCMEGTGEDWPKIAHIPHINFI